MKKYTIFTSVHFKTSQNAYYLFLRLFSWNNNNNKSTHTHPCWFYSRSFQTLRRSMKSHGTCLPVPASLVPPRWRASSSNAKSFGCAYSARAFSIGSSQKSLRACGPSPRLAAKCGWWGRPTLCMCGTCTWTKRMRASHPGRTVRRTTSTIWRDWPISSSRCESESVRASSFPFKSITLSMCNHFFCAVAAILLTPPKDWTTLAEVWNSHGLDVTSVSAADNMAVKG